jgi:MORN repeat variant
MKYAYSFCILLLAISILCTNCKNNPPQNSTKDVSHWVEKRDTFPLGSRIYWLLDNKKDSTMTVFDKNGLKSGLLRFKNDLQEGRTNYFYPSGKLKETQFYSNGKREGSFTVYFENGSIQSTTEFVNNQRNGLFKKWNPDGSLIIETLFKNDSLVRVINSQIIK